MGKNYTMHYFLFRIDGALIESDHDYFIYDDLFYLFHLSFSVQIIGNSDQMERKETVHQYGITGNHYCSYCEYSHV
jgi:hypothetical protein